MIFVSFSKDGGSHLIPNWNTCLGTKKNRQRNPQGPMDLMVIITRSLLILSVWGREVTCTGFDQAISYLVPGVALDKVAVGFHFPARFSGVIGVPCTLVRCRPNSRWEWIRRPVAQSDPNLRASLLLIAPSCFLGSHFGFFCRWLGRDVGPAG